MNEESYSHCDLSGFAAGEQRSFRNCRFEACTFHSARLMDLLTDRCEFHECDFTAARLGGSRHLASSFLNCKFTDADLYGAKFENCRTVGCNLLGANLSNLIVLEGDWSYAQFRMQNLDGIDFSHVKLVGRRLLRMLGEEGMLRRSKPQRCRFLRGKADGLRFERSGYHRRRSERRRLQRSENER